MYCRKGPSIIVLTFLAVLAISLGLSAQSKQNHAYHYHHYRLIDVGTFGGRESFLSSSFDINTAWGVMNQPALEEKGPMQELGILSSTRVAGRCVRRGGQCPPWVKCCPGLRCVPASTRAFCQP